MTPRALALWLAAALLLALFAWRAAGRENEGDLRVYMDTVSRVPAGLDLYQQRETERPERPTAYIYPPLFAVLFLPLTALPFPLLRGLWFFGCGLLALRCWVVTARRARSAVPSLGPPAWRGPLALALGVALSLRFVWSDLGHGQVNTLMAWLVVEGLGLAEGGGGPRRERAGGALLALAVLLKLTPTIVVAGYLLAGRWRVLQGAALGGALGLLAPALVFGPAGTLDLTWRFVTVVTPWNATFHAYVGNNVALGGLVRRLLVGEADAGQVPAPLLLALDPAAVRVACTALSAVVLAGALALGTRLRDPVARAAALLAAIPLVSPIAWKPHLALLVLPGLVAGRWLAAGFAAGRARWALLAAAWVLLVLGAREVLGRAGSAAFISYGGVTAGVALLAAGLFVRGRSADASAREREGIHPSPAEVDDVGAGFTPARPEDEA